MLKKITSSKISLIFIVFILAHLALFDINYAEWGDSYRILRASEFIREGTYPQDEKRQPVYSLLLAVRPDFVDQVWWGRFQMFLISIAFFWIFYKLLDEFDLKDRSKSVAMWLFVFNPVLLYWSLRIMADVPFAALVLLIFYLYTKWKGSLTARRVFTLGVLLGVSVLTRFEGYLVTVAIGAGILLEDKFEFDGKIINRTKIKKILYVIIGFLLSTIPWFLYRDPINSTYFEEPARRAYDLRMVYIYIVSSMFLFGFTSACYFYFKKRYKFIDFIKKNAALGTFLLLELILILLWPAAIPRLFVPVIPFLIIPLSVYIEDHFKDGDKTPFAHLLGLFGLLAFFLISQYFLKLQFLVLIKGFLLVVLVLQIVNIMAIFLKTRFLFLLTLILSSAIWSLSTIWLHKDIFKAVVEANKYTLNNLSGVVVYNDVSSVSDWYLNQKAESDHVRGVYLNMDDREGRSKTNLLDKKADYVLITNEHNTSMEFSPDEVDYLEQITEFRYTIRGKSFFTKVLRFEPNE